MMTKKATNISASVHKLLLNKAKMQQRPFNELLQHYVIERFVYRLASSRYRDRFILKGAIMIACLESPSGKAN